MLTPELAIDGDGEPFAVPEHVTGWRIRRLQPDGRGRPELVYDEVGRPVVLPISATFLDLRTAVGAGRYRLDPIDAAGRADGAVKTATTGYVQPVEAAHDSGATSPRGKAHVRTDSDDIVVELARTNTRLAELVVEKIPAILTAASGLITAADGANLTTRKPLELPPSPAPSPYEYDEEDDDEDAAPPAQQGWVNTLMEALEPQLPLLMSLIGKVPLLLGRLGGLAPEALADWRKAVPQVSASAPTPLPAEPPPAAHGGADAGAHIMAIFQSLSPEERQHAQRLAGRLTAEERDAWMAALAALSVPDAVARVRDLLRPHPTTTIAPRPVMRSSTAPVHPRPETATRTPSSETSVLSSQLAPSAAPALDAIRTGTDAPDAHVSAGPVADASEQAVHAFHSHLRAIWSGLSPDEHANAERLVAQLPSEKRSAWALELADLSVPEAIERVRDTLRRIPSQATQGALAADNASQAVLSATNGKP